MERVQRACEQVLAGHDFRSAGAVAAQSLAVLSGQLRAQPELVDEAMLYAHEIAAVNAGADAATVHVLMDQAIAVADRRGQGSLAARLAVRRAVGSIKAAHNAEASQQLRRAERWVYPFADDSTRLDYLTARHELYGRVGRWNLAAAISERIILPLSRASENPERTRVREAYLARCFIELGDCGRVLGWLESRPALDAQPHVFHRYLEHLIEIRAMVLDPAVGDAGAAFVEAERTRVAHGFDPQAAREVAALL